jgi:hypothetical protein
MVPEYIGWVDGWMVGGWVDATVDRQHT